jgi:hypothetical protein
MTFAKKNQNQITLTFIYQNLFIKHETQAIELLV